MDCRCPHCPYISQFSASRLLSFRVLVPQTQRSYRTFQHARQDIPASSAFWHSLCCRYRFLQYRNSKCNHFADSNSQHQLRDCSASRCRHRVEHCRSDSRTTGLSKSQSSTAMQASQQCRLHTRKVAALECCAGWYQHSKDKSAHCTIRQRRD